jgi:hypothetical protein
MLEIYSKSEARQLLCKFDFNGLFSWIYFKFNRIQWAFLAHSIKK